ncbi:MAG: cytochrome c3 family protein, partial [bacterium]
MYRTILIPVILLLCFSAGTSWGSEEICYSCHDDDILSTNKECALWMNHGHPVYVKPSALITVPPGLPLDEEGRIFCATCHSRKKVVKTLPKNKLIYTDKFVLNLNNDNSTLCKLCHAKQLGLTIDEKIVSSWKAPSLSEKKKEKTSPDPADPMKVKVSLGLSQARGDIFNHPQDILVDRQPKRLVETGGIFGSSSNLMICETCHIMHMSEGEKLLVMKTSSGRLCAQCHPFTNVAGLEDASEKRTHPVNIIPSKATISERLRDRGGKTGPLAQLYCLTCHSIHKARTRKFLLVESNRDSQLCGECHPDELRYLRGTKHDLNTAAASEKNIKKATVGEQGVCSACHVSHRASSARLWARPVKNREDVVSDLCLSCHRIGGIARSTTGANSHPVAVRTGSRPTEDKNLDLPLFSAGGRPSPKGLLTCATCHNPHRWNPKNNDRGASQKSGPENSFLRLSNRKSNLCFRCHREEKEIIETAHNPENNLKSQKTVSSSGKSLCGQCHAIHNAQAARLWNRKLPPGFPDDITAICMNCHSPNLIGTNSHPLNVSTRSLRVTKNSGLPLLNKDYKPDRHGRIYCGTCHDVHKKSRSSKKENFLRVQANDPKDSLCGRCHQNQIKTIQGTGHDLRTAAPEAVNIKRSTADDSGVCSACHVAHGGKSAMLWGRDVFEQKDIISDLCLSCHQGNNAPARTTVGRNSHPVGIHNHTEIQLPLFSETGEINKKGMITCATCHNPHQWAPQETSKSSPANASNSFLRITSSDLNNSQLCNQCHREERWINKTEHDLNLSAPGSKNARGKLPEEISICSNCHRVHNAEYEFRLWNRKLGPGQDSISRLCSSCHNPKGIAGAKSISGFSHPLGKDIFEIMGDIDSLPLPIYGEGYDVLNLREDEATYARNKFYALKQNLSLQSQLSREVLQRLGRKYTWLAKSYARELNEKIDLKQKKKKRKKLMIINNITGGRRHKIPKRKKRKNAQQERIEKMLEEELALFADSYSVIDSALKELSGGKIYCSTCHQVHKWDPKRNAFGSGKKEEGGSGNSFLRIDNSRQRLCLTCHPNKKPVIGSKHDLEPAEPFTRGGTCAACHLTHYAPEQDKMWSRKLPESDQDVMSRLCLSCHQKEKSRKTRNSHPIGLKAPRNASLPLYLKNGHQDNHSGRISCPTCHDVHQGPEEKGTGSSFLRSDMSDYPNLCFGCHRKETEVQFTAHDLTASLSESDRDKGVCYPCHKMHNAYNKRFLWSRIPGPRFLSTWDKSLIKKDDILTKLCTSCHAPRGLASNSIPRQGLHKAGLNFIPRLAKELLFPFPVFSYKNNGYTRKITSTAILKGAKPVSPLFDRKGNISLKGNISCPTCHDVHNWSHKPEPNDRSDYTNNFLKGEIVSSFCADCHGVSGLVKFAYFHDRSSRTRKKASPHWKGKRL